MRFQKKRSHGGPLEGEGRHLSMRHGSKLKNTEPSKTQTERIHMRFYKKSSHSLRV